MAAWWQSLGGGSGDAVPDTPRLLTNAQASASDGAARQELDRLSSGDGGRLLRRSHVQQHLADGGGLTPRAAAARRTSAQGVGGFESWLPPDLAGADTGVAAAGSGSGQRGSPLGPPTGTQWQSQPATVAAGAAAPVDSPRDPRRQVRSGQDLDSAVLCAFFCATVEQRSAGMSPALVVSSARQKLRSS